VVSSNRRREFRPWRPDGGHATGSGCARVALLLAVALLAVLPPLAAASPPDPTWTPGLYDDADFDDVVIFIGLLAGICDALTPPRLAPDSLVRPLAAPGRPPLLCRSQSTIQGRSPPLV
jgi:hypothetical protein